MLVAFDFSLSSLIWVTVEFTLVRVTFVLVQLALVQLAVVLALALVQFASAWGLDVFALVVTLLHRPNH